MDLDASDVGMFGFQERARTVNRGSAPAASPPTGIALGSAGRPRNLGGLDDDPHVGGLF